MGSNYQLATRIEERNQLAHQAELENDLSKASRLYEQNIKEDYADEFAFDRLMIIYRKQKEFEKELKVIERGVELFQQHMKEHLKNSLGRRIDEGTLEQLSDAIIKKSGRKNNDLNYPHPIHTWLKRKEIVEKKLSTHH